MHVGDRREQPFDEALVRLLSLLEVPGIGKLLWVVRTPYRLLRGSQALDLEISPLVTYRDFHTLSHGSGWQPGVQQCSGGVQINAFQQVAEFGRIKDVRGR